jgi:hypothetical protein
MSLFRLIFNKKFRLLRNRFRFFQYVKIYRKNTQNHEILILDKLQPGISDRLLQNLFKMITLSDHPL